MSAEDWVDDYDNLSRSRVGMFANEGPAGAYNARYSCVPWSAVHRVDCPGGAAAALEVLRSELQKLKEPYRSRTLDSGTTEFRIDSPNGLDFICWVNAKGQFWIRAESCRYNFNLAGFLYRLMSGREETEIQTEEEEQTMSEKNAAAFLRNDAKTVGVRLLTETATNKEYTYVTTLSLAVDDLVIVPCVSDQNFNLAKVTRVDEKLCIEPRSGTKYKWVAAKADLIDYQATLEANKQIEEMLADSYRKQAQIAYKEQLLQLAGDNQQLRALIGSGS